MKNIIIYDFDGTLTPYSMPRLDILIKCGVKDGAHNPKFLELARKSAEEKKTDIYEAIYDTYFEIIKNSGLKLTDENFIFGSDDVEYNNGVKEFLNMMEENNVSNYLVSAGIKVFLEKISIAPYFKEIYANTFSYDNKREVNGFEYLMNDKNKVTAIQEILKINGIDIEDTSRIIYIGDGFTDYYAMKYVKEHGGTSIFVYRDFNNKEMMYIKKENVVDFYTKADFSKDSELFNYVTKLCDINN